MSKNKKNKKKNNNQIYKNKWKNTLFAEICLTRGLPERISRVNGDYLYSVPPP
jgi:hypothetical protein